MMALQIAARRAFTSRSLLIRVRILLSRERGSGLPVSTDFRISPDSMGSASLIFRLPFLSGTTVSRIIDQMAGTLVHPSGSIVSSSQNFRAFAENSETVPGNQKRTTSRAELGARPSRNTSVSGSSLEKSDGCPFESLRMVSRTLEASSASVGGSMTELKIHSHSSTASASGAFAQKTVVVSPTRALRRCSPLSARSVLRAVT